MKKKMDYELLFSQTIGIMSVVNGHYTISSTLISRYFPYYSWHMPFFMFLSGILFSRHYEKKSLFHFALHKTKKLFFPAFLVNIAYGIICHVMRHYKFWLLGSDFNLAGVFVTPFQLNYQWRNDVALWFIFQLFILEMLANIIFRIPTKNRGVFEHLLLFVTLCISVYCTHYSRMILTTDRSANVTLLLRTGFLLFFFVFGNFYEKKLKPLMYKLPNPLVGCYMAILLQIIVVMCTNMKPTYGSRKMEMPNLTNDWMPYFTFLTTATLILCLAHWLAPVLEKSSLLKFVGSDIRYVVYHHQFFAIMMGFVVFLIHLSGNKTVIPDFDPIRFRKEVWYTFTIGTTDLKKTHYFIIPFFGPLLLAKFINRSKKQYMRYLWWGGVFVLLLLIFVITGRYFQNEINAL